MTDFPALLDRIELDLILAGDDLDELGELADRLSDWSGLVSARIHELNELSGNPEERELRRDYRQSVL